MSKFKLSISTGEVDPEISKKIHEEIEGYSLTPRKEIKRELTFDKSKTEIPKSELSFSNVIPEESLSKLYMQSLLKGQSRELVIETAKLALENKFFNQVKEQSYINHYNQILSVYNMQKAAPNIFVDDCLSIIRHGINVHTSKATVDSYNHILNKIIESQSKILDDMEGQSNKGSKKSGTQKVSDPINFKVLHPLEIELLINAVFNALTNQHKAILVDIFERDKGGIISVDKIGNPKTHTIVLCRKESVSCKEKIGFLVIDPSNSEFSEHLGLLGVNKIISSLIKEDIQLEVSSKPYKIYEQNSKIGTGLAINKFRDCIDIAFKLAKDFNQIPDQNISFDVNDKLPIIFDTNSIIANNIVKHITNNKNLDNKIKPEMCTESFLDYPFRGKQLTNQLKGNELYEKQMLTFYQINNKVNKLTIPTKSKIVAVEEMQNLLTSSLQEQSKTKEFLNKIDEAYLLINQASSLFGVMTQEEQVSPLGVSLNELGQEFGEYYFQL
jgi:hypothetical protein